MRLKQMNKANAGAVAGAVAALLGSIFTLSPEVTGSIATILAWIVVYFVPNKES